MLVTGISTTPRRRAPILGGPAVATLPPASRSGQVAAVHVEIPAAGGMPGHDHGASEIILIPLSGTTEGRHDGQTRTLSAGLAAHIAAGERVSLANPGPGPAAVMVVASPPEFARRLAKWSAA
ncbi:MAG: cupin domain-containing protein [Actinomycetota bacterium]|nr:cupin domain-containing protein [Actinomycetota bacterium]